jgi:hypothetical protein
MILPACPTPERRQEDGMRLWAPGVTLTAAILWGGSILLVGLVNLVSPPFGASYLSAMSSLHPGFHAARSFADVLVGTVAGFVDGALAGFLFAKLYNWFEGFAETGI